jgi:hypothetical protein
VAGAGRQKIVIYPAGERTATAFPGWLIIAYFVIEIKNGHNAPQRRYLCAGASIPGLGAPTGREWNGRFHTTKRIEDEDSL